MKIKMVTVAGLIMLIETGSAFASDRFSIEGKVLIYDTTFPPETVAEGIFPESQSQQSEKASTAVASDDGDEDSYSVEYSDVSIFREILAERSNIEAVKLTSDGGFAGAGYQIGRIINDYGLDTVADRDCISACTFIFLGGKNRSMTKGSRLGFHHLNWSLANVTEFYESMHEEMGWKDPLEFAEWAYRDGQRDANVLLSYFVTAGVSPDFALDILEHGDERTWYPDRNTLEVANILRSDASNINVTQQGLGGN